ncbi:MAG: hypothetical protein M1818_007442 [Claussenomyces sp. TS43310]|nr:MAG: hypothetical protein M1818_007442 [Claussenomyces sp. TS43310]
MANLPLKIRKDVRDLWDSPDSKIRKKFKELQELLGTEVTVHANWEQLWSEVQQTSPQKDVFVPRSISTVEVVCGVLLVWLEGRGDDPQWVERFLDEIMRAGRLKMNLVARKGDTPKVRWVKQGSTLQVEVPENNSVGVSAARSAVWSDLSGLFGALEIRSDVSASHEDWADVGADLTSEALPAHYQTSLAAAQSGLSYDRRGTGILPTVDTLSKPDELFRTTTPYYMTLYIQSGAILIQASHQPSLELLADYFRQWNNQSGQHSPLLPNLTFQLQESVYGMAPCFDSLRIAPVRGLGWDRINPMYILSFIEGILGYTSVRTDPGAWHFKRTEPLVRV